MNRGLGQIGNALDAIKMKSISVEEPGRLLKNLVGAIVANGGWILSRGASDTGEMRLLIEFERRACVEIYSSLIASGVELGQSGHVQFTELCQRSLSHPPASGPEIAGIDLQIQTFPIEMTRGPRVFLES